MDEAAEDEAVELSEVDASSFVSSVESSVESVESSVEVDAAAEPPVTPWDAWPAAFLSSATLLLSFVCSSVILLVMLDVLLPAALAWASCKVAREVVSVGRSPLPNSDGKHVPGSEAPGPHR